MSIYTFLVFYPYLFQLYFFRPLPLIRYLTSCLMKVPKENDVTATGRIP